MTLNLAVKDIKETIKYYQENFDFKVQMLVDESKTIFDTKIKEELNYVWAMIHKDKVIIYKEIETTWYGQKEFYIKDLNGYILGFTSKNS